RRDAPGMTNVLSGRTVVVTGAANGIGRAIAISAAGHGAKAVVVSDVRDAPREGGPPTTEVIAKLGAEARFVRADVSRRADVDALLDSTEDLGGVDVMVCNAGITAPSDDANVAEDDYRRLLSV